MNHSSSNLAIAATLALFTPLATAAEKPNIVLIYAEDLDYGDVSCYNPNRGKKAAADMKLSHLG